MKFITSLISILFSFTLMAESLPAFKRNPVVYGVCPSLISADGSVRGLEAIRLRLPEIKDLGANIVWLMPITPPLDEDGPGYDVLDYKKVWPQIGTEEDLKLLIQEARRLGMKIILDVVLNHSSNKHPFVIDIIERGKFSPYYDFYQHKIISNVPYAHHFNEGEMGSETFVYYFWSDLLNFDYNSPKLRTYMLDVLAYWIKKFDVDGYRFDASWGPSSRWPEFYSTVSRTLKKIKPDIILLAEDMAGYPRHYKNTKHPHLKNSGFDWAYDWDNSSQDYISKWSFQLDDDPGQTIFNSKNSSQAADHFINALKVSARTEGIKPLRYIENNDTPGILRFHSMDEALWAAKVNFLLPGVPLIFYGQETGIVRDIHELPGFDLRKKMASFNPKLWKFYQNFIALRRNNPVIAEGSMSDLRKLNSSVVEYRLTHLNKTLEVKLDFETKEVYLDKELVQ